MTLIFAVLAALMLSPQSMDSGPTYYETIAQSDTTPKPQFQCAGVTVKGIRCKIKVFNEGDTCRVHSANTPRCGHITKSGTPCRKIVKIVGERCSLHKQKNDVQSRTGNPRAGAEPLPTDSVGTPRQR